MKIIKSISVKESPFGEVKTITLRQYKDEYRIYENSKWIGYSYNKEVYKTLDTALNKYSLVVTDNADLPF